MPLLVINAVKHACFPISPPHRKEPVGGENDVLEIKEQKKKIEDNADATTSVPGCLGQKDNDVLLAMRDQARLVSTAIQLLTSPESNCLSSSPSIYHKICSNEAAEPCDLEKPQPHGQVRVLCVVFFFSLLNMKIGRIYMSRCVLLRSQNCRIWRTGLWLVL